MASTGQTAQSASSPGVQEWVNPSNQLHVLRLHYTADPEKRSAAWKASTAKNHTHRAWLREYEINWATPEGEPVVPDFSEQIHVRSLQVQRGLRGMRWWDFGQVSPAVLFVQLNMWGQRLILRELCPFNTPLRDLWEAVQSITLDLFPDGRIFDAGDPAGENLTDLGSSAQWLLQNHQVQLHSTRPGTEVSYADLRATFQRMVMIPGIGLEPSILIDPSCKNLIMALTGAFHLSTIPPYKPVKKHPFKDVVDALRYGNDCISLVNREYMNALKDMASNDRIDDIGRMARIMEDAR